jgi:hypothetical protein
VDRHISGAVKTAEEKGPVYVTVLLNFFEDLKRKLA